MVAPKYTPKDITRFWSKVDKSGGADSCWNWTAGRNKRNGYGGFHHAGKIPRSHRVAYELTAGTIPDGLEVCHSCDNPVCCNPLHLFLGTHLENMQDRELKGRGRTPDNSGESHGMSKLTCEQVATIRTRYSAGGVTYTALAAEYGVSKSTIGDIIRGRRWKHL